MARAFREQFGLTELYLADLDAIAGGDPALAAYAELKADGFRLWIDAGVRAMDRVRLLADAGVEGIVVGLETVAGPDVLRRGVRRVRENGSSSLWISERGNRSATGRLGERTIPRRLRGRPSRSASGG